MIVRYKTGKDGRTHKERSRTEDAQEVQGQRQLKELVIAKQDQFSRVGKLWPLLGSLTQSPPLKPVQLLGPKAQPQHGTDDNDNDDDDNEKEKKEEQEEKEEAHAHLNVHPHPHGSSS